NKTVDDNIDRNVTVNQTSAITIISHKKLLSSVRIACKKRMISAKKQENIVNNVERRIRDNSLSEIDSTEVGKYVMDELVDVDDVAYIRFASVYREFKDIEVFMKEMKALEEKKSK